MTLGSTPASSPTRIMLTYSLLNERGCSPIADDRDPPFRTDSETCAAASPFDAQTSRLDGNKPLSPRSLSAALRSEASITPCTALPLSSTAWYRNEFIPSNLLTTPSGFPPGSLCHQPLFSAHP